MSDARWDRFRFELERATRRNAGVAAGAPRRPHPFIAGAGSPADVMATIRRELPYRYNASLPTVDLWAAQRRGFAACAEAAAAIAGFALLHGMPAGVCLELLPGRDRYAHVVTYVQGAPFDVYADAALAGGACMEVWRI